MSKKTMKSSLAAVTGVVAMSTTLLGACSTVGESASSDSGAAEGGTCEKVSFLVSDLNPFVITMTEGAQAKGEELGVDVDVQTAKFDVSTQISQIQQAIAADVDGILIQAADANGLQSAVQQAMDAGIPVITVNSTVSEDTDIVTFVGVNDTDYGTGLGQLTREALPDGGKIAIIEGAIGYPATIQRSEGLMAEIEDAGNFEILTTVNDDWANDKNLAAVQDILNKYPKGEIDAIIAEGPQIYVGAQYARETGRDDVLFIAGDYPTQVRDAIEAGEIYGTVAQDGAAQGSVALESMCNWIEGNRDKVETPVTWVESPVVTKKNVADYPTNWDW